MLPQPAIADPILTDFACIYAQIAPYPPGVIRGHGRQSKFHPALSMSLGCDFKSLARFLPDTGQANPQCSGNIGCCRITYCALSHDDRSMETKAVLERMAMIEQTEAKRKAKKAS